MVDYKTINVREGSLVDEYLIGLMEDDGPVNSYSQAGNYLMRTAIQREAKQREAGDARHIRNMFASQLGGETVEKEHRLANAEPKTVPEPAERDNGEAVFDNE